MSGLIAIIIITWIAARLFRLPPISDVLGLLPPRRIAGLGGVLFLSVALCCASGYLVRSLMADEFFGFNQNLDPGELASGIAATVLSVLFEELLFRGVVLYLLIRKIGEKWAILISSLAFGALHLNVVSDWGNLPQIVLTLIYPFLLGLVLAYAFARHGSIILPIAIHLGWNLVQNVLFSDTPNAGTLLVLIHRPVVIVSYLEFFMIIAFSKLAAITISFVLVRRSRQSLAEYQKQ